MPLYIYDLDYCDYNLPVVMGYLSHAQHEVGDIIDYNGFRVTVISKGLFSDYILFFKDL